MRDIPTRAWKPCAAMHCPNLTQAAYCEEHQTKTSKRRTSANYQHLYNRSWQKYRKSFLLSHPFCKCQACLRSQTPELAEVVDHIKPHKGDLHLFWDPTNHQPMNKRCHDRKTASEDGGFGNNRK